MAKRKTTKASTQASASTWHGKLAVELVMRAPDAKPPIQRWLVKHLTHVAALAGIHGGRVTLLIVGDEEMAALHEQYRQTPGTTDVLTFDLRESASDPMDADIALCIDEARRQAATRGHDVRLELLLYAVHGLLHLCGYDDHTKAAYERMHRREDELLEMAGMGRVFRR
jgi:probable rRNA maturation factor